MIGRGQQFILVLAMVSPATQGDVIETMDGKSVDEVNVVPKVLEENEPNPLNLTDGKVNDFCTDSETLAPTFARSSKRIGI